MKGELRGSEEKREKRLTEEEGRKRGMEEEKFNILTLG